MIKYKCTYNCALSWLKCTILTFFYTFFGTLKSRRITVQSKLEASQDRYKVWRLFCGKMCKIYEMTWQISGELYLLIGCKHRMPHRGGKWMPVRRGGGISGTQKSFPQTLINVMGVYGPKEFLKSFPRFPHKRYGCMMGLQGSRKSFPRFPHKRQGFMMGLQGS